MKKINYYELNDEIGGMMFAKSLKQAVKMIAKYHNYTTVSAIIADIKRNEDVENDGEFYLTDVCQFPKKKNSKKSIFLGICD